MTLDEMREYTRNLESFSKAGGLQCATEFYGKVSMLIDIAKATKEAFDNGNISCEPDANCPACRLVDLFKEIGDEVKYDNRLR